MKPLKEFIRDIKIYGLENILHRYYSVYKARVIDNDDPDGLHRLRLHIPIIHQMGVSQWVRGYGYPSGNDYGLHSLPRIGDYVFVKFEMGDARKPKWNYGWYADGELPDEFKKPNVHGFKSPAGHSVIIDDDEDRITVTMNGGKTIMIDKDVIELNGNNLGGLVIADETANKISKLENQVNSLLTALNSIVVPLAPSGSYPLAPNFVNITPITPTTQASDLENKKVKHGDN